MDRIARGQDAARRAYADAPERLRKLHEARFGCTVWTEFTETVRQFGAAGFADVHYIGCRIHGVKIAR